MAGYQESGFQRPDPSDSHRFPELYQSDPRQGPDSAASVFSCEDEFWVGAKAGQPCSQHHRLKVQADSQY